MRIRGSVAWFLVLAMCACVRSDVAPGVSPAGILSVELGMSKEEVIAILGMPFAVSARLNVPALPRVWDSWPLIPETPLPRICDPR